MKFFIILLCLITSTVYGQTNYNTILAPKKDSTTINLRLNKIERLNTTSHLLFAAGVVSTMVIYNLNNKSPMMFVVPLGFCLSGMGLHIYQSHLESKFD